MHTYTFTINISPCQESFVDFHVTDEELALIREAIDNGDLFDEAGELSDLYERVMEAAREKLEEDLDLTGVDIDLDDLDFTVSFSEEE